MAYINTQNEAPGIIGLMLFRKETAIPLNMLAETLLRSPNSLTQGEREIIAAYVSFLNNCEFCCNSHSAFASYYLKNKEIVKAVKTNPETNLVSKKMNSLLKIAAKVQISGKNVSAHDIDNARKSGATENEIHDTVLIAAAFCMFNRYVDGLGTFAPKEEVQYDHMAQMICEGGYKV
jgi:uncharacterized peroxidase-related enzyme